MITVNDILRICNGKLICGDVNLECINFCNDSRKITKGDVYIGIQGENLDGNTFYKDAIENGAYICILDNDEVIDYDNLTNTIILVNDSVKAIQELAKYKRSLYDIPVIGITGSVGKTSVKDIVSKVVGSKYKVLYTLGNYNNEIGLPLTILRLKDEEAMVLEMGTNHFGEIHLLSEIAKPTIGIITTIGTAHIGILGSRENILKAKLEILDGMDNGKLIINNDNDLLHTIKYDNLVTVGIINKSDYMADNINDMGFNSEFKINDKLVKLPVGSNAFIYNALLAYAVGDLLGIDSDSIIEALANFTITPHRLELIKTKKYNIIDDTYNASLDSVKNSLVLLSKMNGRKVFIFADILECDGYEEEIHRKIGYECLNNKIDIVICVGNHSKYTYDEVKNIESYHYKTNDELLLNIDNILNDGDNILIKGSNSMKLIDIVNYLSK